MIGVYEISYIDIYDTDRTFRYNTIPIRAMKALKIIAAVLLVLCGLWILAMTAISGPFFALFPNEMSNLIISLSFGIVLLAFGGGLFFR
jgi:hypothetical protein